MQKKKPFHSGVHPSAAPHPAAGGRNNAGPGQRRDFAKRDKNDHYINDQIRAHEVRLVGDNVEEGVYPIAKAQRIADDQGLDLILIAPQAQPPVCRIMDYQKFQYQQRKRLKEQKAKQAKVVVKEIRFGPQTDDHDYDFKLKHAIGFLQDGCKVKSYVFFKGRSILFKDQGELLLTKFTSDLEEYGKPDQWPPVLEGKRMTVMISPKKNKDVKKAAPKPQAEPKPEEPSGEAE